MIAELLDRRIPRKQSEARTFFTDMGIAGPTAAGEDVNEDVALTYSAVFCAVRIIAETTAGLPFHVYKRRKSGGKDRVTDDAVDNVLNREANTLMDYLAVREAMTGHMATWGNGYAKIGRTGRKGEPASIVPLNPARMHRRWNKRKDVLLYEYHTPRGGVEVMLPDQVLHPFGLGSDGLSGYSVIGLARESVGACIAAEKFGATLFRNGARPGGVISRSIEAGKLEGDNFKRFKENVKSWADPQNRHGTMILQEGMAWQGAGFPPEDAQFLETRQHGVTEVARWFRLPPHMLADLLRATFSNITHQAIEFVRYSMAPWLLRWEAEVNRKLLKPPYFAEHNVEGLLRGDPETRGKFYQALFQVGGITINDILRHENQNTIGPDGDIRYVPLNMVPVGTQQEADDGSNESNAAAQDTDGSEAGRRSDSCGCGAEHGAAESRDGHATELRAAAEARSVAARQKLAAAYAPIFRDAATRIVRKETKAIRGAIKRHLAERGAQSMAEWVDDWYTRNQPVFQDMMAPAVRSYAEAVHATAMEQLNSDEGFGPRLEKLSASYAEKFSQRHVQSSRGQVQQLLRDTTPDDAADAVNQRMDEWDEKRPDKITNREVVQAAGAVLVASFALMGVTRLRWTVVGPTCPICEEMDGRVVGVDKTFAEPGDKFSTLTVSSPVRHPPLHQGCDCQIVPEIG